MKPLPTASAVRLEALLADPYEPDSPFSYRRALDDDRGVRFPGAACAALDRWGLPAYYVPRAYGGALTDHAELHRLLRTLARRDLALAAAHGQTPIAATPVWLSGDDRAAHRLGARITAGSRVASALTGAAGGPRVRNAGIAAYPAPGGYRVRGEAWAIGDAPRSGYVCALARTSPVAGPRASSLVLIDRTSAPADGAGLLPTMPTQGIRGTGTGGVVFDDALFGPDLLVGNEGTGPETVLKAHQLNWVLGSAFSLGAAESALCTVTAGPPGRTGPRSTAPDLRRELGVSYADLLLCEALCTVGLRGVRGLPSELSVISASVGFVVSSVVAGLLERTLDGSRADGAAGALHHAVLDKTVRDHRTLRALGAAEPLCLQVLAAQFRPLADAYLTTTPHRPRLPALYGLGRVLPPPATEHLTLTSRYGSSVVGGLPGSVGRLRELARHEPVLRGAARLAGRLLDRADALHHRIARCRRGPAAGPAEANAAATAFAHCFAGAAALALWTHNRGAVRDGPVAVWADGLWLEGALVRVLHRLGEAPGDTVWADRLGAALLTRREAGLPLALLPCPPEADARTAPC